KASAVHGIAPREYIQRISINIKMPEMNKREGYYRPPTMQPDHPTGEIAKSISSALDNIYQGCQSEKGCFGLPDNCVSEKNCDFLMTYTKSPSEGGYRIEIAGDVDGSSGYVAGALSMDESMGDDSVMICRTENGITDVLMAWNPGKSNDILEDSKLGISNEATSFMDGRIYCSFVRDVETNIMGNDFNLDTDKYNLMVAAGGVGSGNSIGYHTVGRSVSAGEQISLGSFASVAGKDDSARTLHACFMVVAWVFAASAGMLMARYFKKTWRGSKYRNIDQWFHWHRFLMGLTWLLTMVGFVLIVVDLKGLSQIPFSDNPHVVFGFLSTAFCFIQPFMALLRCSPVDPMRPLFNWLHWFAGNSAHIMGIVAIFYGLKLWKAAYGASLLLFIFVVSHCFVHIVLTIGEWFINSKAEQISNNIPMQDEHGSQTPLNFVDKGEDAPGGTFRKAMLAFYIVVNFSITLALIIMISG
ncbi:unnamed protein product, partial [Meganyctiphanes norvegica]